MSKFEYYFRKQAKNIKGCTQLNPEIKAAFFAETDGIAPETDIALARQAVKHKAEEHFYNNQFKGEPLTLKGGERLGRLQKWSALDDHIQNFSKSSKRDSFDKEKLDLLKDRVNTRDFSALEETFEQLEESPLSPFLTWCFRTHTPAPFDGINLSFLPCRLGLKVLKIQEYFPIEITPPINIVAKVPTAFDAGMDQYWCPGGKTRHRGGCKCQEDAGLDEVVIKDGLTYSHAKPPQNIIKKQGLK